MNILKEIVAYKRVVLAKQKEVLPEAELMRGLDKPLPRPRFREVIARSGRIHLLAELKKASPSAGVIRPDFDPAAIASGFRQAGVSCLSVVTEDKFFQGRLSFLETAKKTAALPVLRKDFIIDAYQIYESKAAAADAILLIQALLSGPQLKRFLALSARLKLDTVVEVHSLSELKKALDSGAGIIGINTRNLVDFSVDLDILTRLLKFIPQDRLVIAESGVKGLSDLAVFKTQKINAVLVGEALMRSKDPGRRAKEFVEFLKG